MNKRIKEIQKAIKLLGWTEVSARIRSPEDRFIFTELSNKFLASGKTRGDEILKKHRIEF